MTFPNLPTPGALLADDPFWRYPSACLAGEGVAHLRVWETAGGGRLAVVTETGLGASITNSIEDIWHALAGEHGQGVVLLEHWPIGEDGLEEHVDQVAVTGRTPAWRRVWPTPDTNPDHRAFDAWMAAYGQSILSWP